MSYFTVRDDTKTIKTLFFDMTVQASDAGAFEAWAITKGLDFYWPVGHPIVEGTVVITVEPGDEKDIMYAKLTWG